VGQHHLAIVNDLLEGSGHSPQPRYICSINAPKHFRQEVLV
jgi:hypothetical protein